MSRLTPLRTETRATAKTLKETQADKAHLGTPCNPGQAGRPSKARTSSESASQANASVGDQVVESEPRLGFGHVRREATPGAEQDEGQLTAGRLLVALERLPGTLTIGLDRLGRQHPVDHLGRSAGETECSSEPERHRPSMAHRSVRPCFERVRERVPEVENLARPTVVRVAQAERGLVSGGAPYEL